MVVRGVLAAWKIGASISVLFHITVLGGILGVLVILVIVVMGNGGVVRAIVVVATVVGVDEDWIVKEVFVDQVLI